MGNELLATLLLGGLAAFLLSRLLDWNELPAVWQRRRLLTITGGLGAVLVTILFAVRAVVSAQPSSLPANHGVATQTTADDEQGQRRDRQDGYGAGFALGANPHHHGSKVPNPEALAGLAAVRCRSRSASFLDGFKRGYVAGLTNESAVPPAGKPML